MLANGFLNTKKIQDKKAVHFGQLFYFKSI